jgi:hypothetical protein
MLVNLFAAIVNLCKIWLSHQREVEVVGEAVIAEVTAFERRAAFEDEG